MIQQNVAKLTSDKTRPELRVCAICKRMQANNEASDANGLFGDKEHPFVKSYTSIYGDPDDYDTMFPVTIADDHDTPVLAANIPPKGAPEYQSQSSFSGNWGSKVCMLLSYISSKDIILIVLGIACFFLTLVQVV
ncbi:uncharacterized protein DS421_19g646090 [Arachis hypogaea]|uniref:Uncharacterized protein n=1 Tax=Arachis hypogaea TaxID=3818 RepID=A0A6B9V6K3_ARAHY|nr:uncharacterized protein DS421_19g646090 [Arachis hypogaea]